MEEMKPSLKRSFPDDDDLNNKASSNKRVRFPKGKKVKPGEEVVGISQTEDGGQTEWDKDPLAAAKVRAKRRSQMTTELCSEENRGILNDISAAEVNYEEHEDFVDEGIQIEPFNLEKEREEGYFDAEGNFVEYVNENETKDAWLDSVEADPNFARGAPMARASMASNIEEGNDDLSSAEIGKIKRRIADMLEPEETVLQALKRLKGTSTNRKEKMPPEIKVLFDQLTEDAVKLMENGDYNVYHEKQNVFQREAEGYERLACARGEGTSSSGNGNPDSVLGMPSHSNILNTGVASSVLPNTSMDATTGNISSSDGTDTFDMFAGDDEDSVPITNSDGMNQPPSETLNLDSETMALQSDYVYDESSGYYYSSSLGYYYDPSSKLYCCASSGQWYSFNEDTGAYQEIHEAASV